MHICHCYNSEFHVHFEGEYIKVLPSGCGGFRDEFGAGTGAPGGRGRGREHGKKNPKRIDTSDQMRTDGKRRKHWIFEKNNLFSHVIFNWV